MSAPETNQHVSWVCGHRIMFPYKCYGPQLALMSKLLTALKRSENALLEAPTGTGKTLALLCAALQWQLDFKNNPDPNNINAVKQEDGASSQRNGTNNSIPTLNVEIKQESVQEVKQEPKHVEIKKEIKPDPQPSVINLEDDNGINKNKKLTPDDKNRITLDLSELDDDFQPTKRVFVTSNNKKRSLDNSLNSIEDTKSSAKKRKVDPSKTSAKASVKKEPSGSSKTPREPKKKKSRDGDSDDEGSQTPRPQVPKIYYASRTHAQVKKVVAELRKTPYRPKMAVIGSRDHTCVHPTISLSRTRDTDCRKLVDTPQGCAYKNRKSVLTEREDLKTEPWDLEDIVLLGQDKKACPYFGAKTLSYKADLVLCPYNYLLDPGIRESFKIELLGAVVIFDEAHNIEDAAREATTMDFTLEDLVALADELHMINLTPLAEHFGPFATIIDGLLTWIRKAIGNLKPTDFETNSNVWNGADLVTLFADYGVTAESITGLIGKLNHGLAVNNESEERLFSQKNEILISHLFRIAHYLTTQQYRFQHDYKVVIQKTLVPKNGRRMWSYSIGLWCLNPAVAFTQITGVARTIIVTSGTLSPMETFAGELATKFPHNVQTNHVIDTTKQIWVGALAPKTVKFNSVYTNSVSFEYQDAIGAALLQYCQVIPHGVLCFFPSYGLMDKMIERWTNTGLWHQVQCLKTVAIEPRSAEENFAGVMSTYYSATESAEGALFCAVCRGKVSEGLDFSDHNARAVIVIGIPFPLVKDLKIVLKKEFNTQRKQSLGLLDGNSWYALQAYRAVNQAIGRCIRHIQDYGAIILLDERYARDECANKLSKWIRGCLKTYTSVESSLPALRGFFAANK